jgi:hydrogenase small subunit
LSAIDKIHVVWIHGQSCSGDTVSFLNSTHPSVLDLLTGFIPQAAGVILDFQPTIMLPWGVEAMKAVEAAEKGELDPFVLLVEGAIPNEGLNKENGGHFCIFGEDEQGNVLSFNERLDRLSKKAAAIVAVGTCATFGGVVHGKPNPTGATGVYDYLGRNWKSKLGVPVINVAGCPAQAEHLAETLAHLVLTVRGYLPLPELDEFNRPMFIFSHTAHENCPRGARYASGDISKNFGDAGCMGGLGCKGPVSKCDVPKRGFVEGVGGCPTVGSNCIGCTQPGFPDAPYSPFLEKAPATAFLMDKLYDIPPSLRMVLSRIRVSLIGRDL